MSLNSVGLLLSRDLIFTSKITGTARVMGVQVLVAGNAALASSIIEQSKPKVVFVDLAAGELVSVPSLIAFKTLADPETPFVAFGSHVDTAALDSARAAGCTSVMPRSRFTTELPQLIAHFLGGTTRCNRQVK